MPTHEYDTDFQPCPSSLDVALDFLEFEVEFEEAWRFLTYQPARQRRHDPLAATVSAPGAMAAMAAVSKLTK
jgi:hypothetical protein